MSPLRRPAAVVAVLLVVVMMRGPPAVSAAEAGPQTLTLYGGANRGWGLNATVVTDPGPDITAYVGYRLTLLLVSVDNPSVTHDWFIDYDGNRQRDVGEPVSENFNGPGPTPYTFVPDRVGNWTYYCSFHPGTMTGTIRIVAQTNVTLYGDKDLGWGLSNASIGSPGPFLAFLAGTNVTFHLFSNDSDPRDVHDFFIDYNGDQSPSSGENKSDDFFAGNPVTVTFHLIRGGSFTYHCQYHANMQGNVIIIGPSGAAPGSNVGLIPGIMLSALGGVLVFAAVYHVRAVRAAKRHR